MVWRRGKESGWLVALEWRERKGLLRGYLALAECREETPRVSADLGPAEPNNSAGPARFNEHEDI